MTIDNSDTIASAELDWIRTHASGALAPGCQSIMSGAVFQDT